MTAPFKHPLCAVIPTAQIGHNGGPDLAEAIARALGPRPPVKPAIFQSGAPWTAYASNDELRRLGCLEGRITRRQQAINDLRAERTKIMMRCVRRMRREQGVE
jgi:hypothetical protein